MFAGWKVAAAAAGLAVLAGAWGLYERRGAQLATERMERAEELAETLQRALMASEAEAGKQREISAAADRAISTLIAAREATRTRIVTVVREVSVAPDAQSPVCPAVGIALDRLRGIDAIDRSPDPRRAPGAAPGPPARPGATRGAIAARDQRRGG